MGNIKIFPLYNDLKGTVNTWQGGHARPLSFFTWVHQSQLGMQNDLIKDFEEHQIITDNLRMFLKRVQISIKDLPAGGIIPYPLDYRYFSSLRFFSREQQGSGCICSDFKMLGSDADQDYCREFTEEEKAESVKSVDLWENEIEKVDNQRWGAVCSHQIIPPSTKNPYCTQYDQGFKIMPKEIGIVILDYIALPKRPRFYYTLDKKHNIICDTSKPIIDLQWGEEMLPELISRLKKDYGSFTNDDRKYAQGESERKIAVNP